MLQRNPTTDPSPMAAQERSFYAALGRRIAEHRKAAGLTQAQLAERLGIAQQTMAHYEGGVSRIPVETLAQAATTLGVGVEAMIGTSARHGAGKRGPAPKLQQQLERVQALPKAQQRFVIQMIDTVLQQEAR